ncbi:hypothetical protein B0G80_4100 [Paraburkholderia sp. BL6669N2]|nr:hypothetical protein B0G80_4100 [Paraburkholderia sp. BL6669N2]
MSEKIKQKHALVHLPDLTNCERLDASMSESLLSGQGRPATSPHLECELLGGAGVEQWLTRVGET